MHLQTLSSSALTLLLAFNAATSLVDAKINVLSWEDAYEKAGSLVSQMSTEQKVSIATGIQWQRGLCMGNTYGTEEPYFPSLCLQDSPLGIRHAANVTSGVAGINAAASWDKKVE